MCMLICPLTTGGQWMITWHQDVEPRGESMRTCCLCCDQAPCSPERRGMNTRQHHAREYASVLSAVCSFPSFPDRRGVYSRHRKCAEHAHFESVACSSKRDALDFLLWWASSWLALATRRRPRSERRGGHAYFESAACSSKRDALDFLLWWASSWLALATRSRPRSTASIGAVRSVVLDIV